MPDEGLSRAERTREKIIQAAHQLFVQQGYHGTSMRQIANLSGVALGSLYNHFPSKEEVFRVVFIDHHPYHEILPALLMAQGEDVEAVVRDAAYRLLKSLEHHPDFLNLMFIELVEFNGAHVQELFTALLPRGMQIAQRFSNFGNDRLRPIPQPMLLRSFLGLFFSYYITELIVTNVAPPSFSQDAMEYFINIYLHGILAES